MVNRIGEHMKENIKNISSKLDISEDEIEKWLNTFKGLINNKQIETTPTSKSLRPFRIIKNGLKKGKDIEAIKIQLINYQMNLNLTEYKIRNGTENEKISSPLRFPGSKSKVLGRFVPYFDSPHIEYREPFVGGGSIFFGKAKARHNILNDIDENVYSFFIALRDYPKELCELVLNNYPSVELWKQKRQQTFHQSIIEKGFDFLFFNRTNYSGIYNASLLGGVEQKSNYPIDCRWNPTLLCQSIISCSEKLKDVTIMNQNFDTIITMPGENVLLIIDPPYYKQGHKLYPISMKHEDHVRLAKLLRETNHRYLLTIDDCEETRAIYMHENCYMNQENWYYTINSNKSGKLGKELFISNFKV